MRDDSAGLLTTFTRIVQIAFRFCSWHALSLSRSLPSNSENVNSMLDASMARDLLQRGDYTRKSNLLTPHRMPIGIFKNSNSFHFNRVFWLDMFSLYIVLECSNLGLSLPFMHLSAFAFDAFCLPLVCSQLQIYTTACASIEIGLYLNLTLKLTSLWKRYCSSTQ